MLENKKPGLNVEEQRIVELVKQFQKGDKDAFDKIYSLLYNSMFYFIYKMVRNVQTAEDILQDVFMTAYQKIPGIEKPQGFKKWINTTAYHACVDYIRSSQNRMSMTEDIDGHETLPAENDSKSDALLYVLEQEKKTKIKKALDTLSLPLKTTVMLKFYGGFKEREIAEIMDVPVGTVKSRLNAAKKDLSGQLTGLYSFTPFFFLQIAFMHQAGKSGGMAAGLKLQSGTVRRLSVVATGAAVGAAAVVITQGPMITSLKIYEPDQYVNQQVIEFSVSDLIPLSGAEIVGTNVSVKEENGIYRAEITENGTYSVRVTDKNGRSEEKEVIIDNIDNQCPEYVSYVEDGEHVILAFHDRISGMAWDAVSFTGAEGQKIKADGADPEQGTVAIHKKHFPLDAYMEDKAGNYGTYRIDLNTVTLKEKRNIQDDPVKAEQEFAAEAEQEIAMGAEQEIAIRAEQEIAMGTEQELAGGGGGIFE